jgi:acyl-CoA dehydrogenase
MAGAQSVHANVYATQVRMLPRCRESVIDSIQPIAKFATPEQRKDMLAPLIKGETRTCFGV